MSLGGFHVHGPHDHEIKHAIERVAHEANSRRGIGGGSFTNQVATFTAIAAAVGAVFSYMGGATQANAVLYKNKAAIEKTAAADTWNFYQARSTKQIMAELLRDLNTDAKKKDEYEARVVRYEAEKQGIKKQAEELEKEVVRLEAESGKELHLHHRWAQAATLLQVSVALAAVALLSRRRWMEYLMFGCGGLGAVLGCAAMLGL